MGKYLATYLCAAEVGAPVWRARWVRERDLVRKEEDVMHYAQGVMYYID